MPGTPKAGVDWAEIELGWRGGASSSQLARLHDVTRQAIEKRRDRQGWTRDEAAAALLETDTGKRITEPETRADRRIIANGQRTLANMQAVLDIITEGGSQRLAAQRIGMSPNALKNWLESDPDFTRMAEAAEAEAALRAIDRVSAAGARGEWKASAWMLERLAVTRDDYAPKQAGMPDHGMPPVMNIVFADRRLAEQIARHATGTTGPAQIFVQQEDGSLQAVTLDQPQQSVPVLEH